MQRDIYSYRKDDQKEVRLWQIFVRNCKKNFSFKPGKREQLEKEYDGKSSNFGRAFSGMRNTIKGNFSISRVIFVSILFQKISSLPMTGNEYKSQIGFDEQKLPASKENINNFCIIMRTSEKLSKQSPNLEVVSFFPKSPLETVHPYKNALFSVLRTSETFSCPKDNSF